jgi:LCCL domain-containing protein
MRALVPVALGAILLCRAPAAPAQEDLPKAAQEVLKQYEEETAAIEKRVDPAIRKNREKAMAELKKIQDGYCREAKLDEAVAVRDLIRSLQAGGDMEPGADLPAAAREVLKQYRQEEAEVYDMAEADAKKWAEKTLSELQKLQDSYCREAKLDEAVAVRELIRGILDGGNTALPDPGNLARPESVVGKVFYYNVTGATTGGAVYGSDVYVTGSTLSMAAVHAGVLKEGQRGVVKVTILPGRQTYAATTRNGITSNAYGADTASYKVERAYGFLPKIGYGKALADPGTLSAYRGQNGKVYLFEVTGRADLAIAGTDIYTDDSALATAAVHAGALSAGQTGVVRVTILPGQANYPGTTRHGVTSIASPNYPGSYRVERASVRGNR